MDYIGIDIKTLSLRSVESYYYGGKVKLEGVGKMTRHNL